MENRFLEMDRDFRNISARGGSRGRGFGSPLSLTAERSFSWDRSMSATQRVLVILMENGGVDLGIPDLVDKILDLLPMSSLIPNSVKTQLVDFLRSQLKSFTDNLLENAELTLNRYSAAKPDIYSDVVVLRNATAGYADLKSQLISLSQAGKLIDVLVLTHGSSDYIWANGGITGDMIRAIKTEYGKPLSIRAVYMMNCVGASLNKAWQDAGARVSSGSRGNNYLPEPTMFFFWQNWKSGQTFESAATTAYATTVKMMNDAVKGFLGALPLPGIDGFIGTFDFSSFDFVQQSAPVVDGQRSLTITTDDISFSQSTSTGMATTVIPVRNLLRSLSNGDAGAAPASNGAMGVSAAGVEFVKGWEGFVDKLYNDPVGHCTVGYGSLLHQGNCDGRDSEQPYLSGITKEDATKLLAAELAEKQKAVSGAVKVTLNQNQNDALVSFAFNVGVGAFKKSTLLKLLNQGKYDAVPDELKKWTEARKDGKLIDLPGLVNRRAAEATLFQTPVTAASQSTSSFPLGRYGRMLSQGGVVVPVRHSSRYYSPSLVVRAQSNYAVQQNPAVIAGIEVADAIQIGLAGVSIAQAQVSASQGSFSLSYDKAERLLAPEARSKMPGSQTTKKKYSLELMNIGSAGPGVDFAHARLIIEWEGNPYGEMSTVVIRRDLANSSEWSKSSNNTTITKFDGIPVPGTDPRTWPIVYTFEGTFDPVGNGYFEYSGEFEINAFGGLKFNRHEVVSRSLIDFAISGQPEDYVRKGADVVVKVPDIPKEQVDYLRTQLP